MQLSNHRDAPSTPGGAASKGTVTVERARDLPGSRIPALINAIGYSRDPIGYNRWFSRRYGPVTSPRFPGFPMMVKVAEPELARAIFTGDPAVLHVAGSTKAALEPTVGDHSVLALDGPAHMRERKLLLEPFHGENVARWEASIRTITEQNIATWPTERPFALHDHTRRITLEVILRVVFGVRDQARFEQAQKLVREFADRAHLISLFPAMRRDLGPLSPWSRFKRSRAAFDSFLEEEITQRRTEPDLAERDDILSLLLTARDDEDQPLSQQELRDQLVTVVAAGHETTATALAWAFERILHTPRVLDRLTHSLTDGDEYLDATVTETLRARPIGTDASRQLTRDIQLGDYHIAAGTLVNAAIVGIHYREDLYPEPDEFRPERFTEDSPPPYTWIPFGGGVHRCIGAAFAPFEMRVVIRTILERAQLRAASSRPERSKLRNVTAAPNRGCRVVLERGSPR